jgi:7,8-dihydroneopterin aldolase/epimerase/oxygenase
MSGTDRIRLQGMRARGRHGWFDWEREQGQEFVVDVELSVDTAPAARSDDLADTVDYGGLASAVVAIVEGEPVRLVETLAQRIADECLRDGRVSSVTVTVHKPQAPVQVELTDVAVTVTRDRA